MKKLLTFVLTLCLLAAMTLCAFAAGAGELKVADVTANPGEEVRVSVTLSNNPGIVAARLFLSYDKKMLTLTAVENGTVFTDKQALFGNDLTAQPYAVLWEDALSTTDHTDNGVLVTFVFRVAETATGRTAVKIQPDASSIFNADLNNVTLKVQDGSVTTPGGASTGNRLVALVRAIVDFVRRVINDLIRHFSILKLR